VLVARPLQRSFRRLDQPLICRRQQLSNDARTWATLPIFPGLFVEADLGNSYLSGEDEIPPTLPVREFRLDNHVSMPGSFESGGI
jgi:hypothetical protein